MDIRKILTKEEKEFIRSYGLDISEFYDVRGLGGPKKYHDLVKANGCSFVIGNYCNNGHRLKNRHGHCIMCKTYNITFQKRFSENGILYIAVAGEHCKVGIVENNYNDIGEAIYHRTITLNMDDGYGNITGWKIVKHWEIKNAGRLEDEVHQLLARYKEEDVYYWYSGELRTAKELFKCSQRKAENAVKKVLDEYTL